MRLVVLFTMFALRFLSSRRVHACISRGASIIRVALQFFAWRFSFSRGALVVGVAPATTMDSAHKIEYVDYFILAVLPIVKPKSRYYKERQVDRKKRKAIRW